MSSPSSSWLPRLDGLTVVMQIAAAACVFSALALTLFGPYRYLASGRR